MTDNLTDLLHDPIQQNQTGPKAYIDLEYLINREDQAKDLPLKFNKQRVKALDPHRVN